MKNIIYINRETKAKEKEKVPYKTCLEVLYHNNPFSWFFRTLLCKTPLFSKFFGSLQKTAASKKRVQPFIEKYQIDTSEFQDSVESFHTFNDFFTRRLKSSARPIANGNDVAVLPADGRYLAFSSVHDEAGFFVKGKKLSLETLIGDARIAHKYIHGSLVMARLAPVDYHRFHFPFNCTPNEARLIPGSLYAVSPIALKKKIEILTENKRMITHLKTTHFGTVLYIEIGATNVGSIVQTYEPNKHYAKGDEKGYFEFGGSCIILLFAPGRIHLDQDLLENTRQGFETLGKLGQTLGRALAPM